MTSQWRLLAVAAATFLALAGCATVTPDGSLSIDARPNQTYVVVLQGTTTVYAGYGDVTLSGLASGDYTLLAARGERSNTTTVHVAPGRSTSADAHVTESDDSDQPEWAGRNGDREKTPGSGMQGSDTEKGDLFGDLYILVRNDNGEPELIEKGGEWYVQPAAFVADASGLPGEPVLVDGAYVPLALDDEGGIITPQYYPDPTVDTGTLVVPKEVDLGRLNEARAPDNVLQRAYEEAMANLSSSVQKITLDPMGRLEYYAEPDVPTAIDSPLENLALYKALMTDGFLEVKRTNPDGSETVLFRSDERTPDFVNTHLAGDPFGVSDDDVIRKHIMLDYAAAMLSAAADKTGDLDVDVVITMNNFLGINGETAPEYFQFGAYHHQRSGHFGTEQADLLQPYTNNDPNADPGDYYVVKSVPLYDTDPTAGAILKTERSADFAKGFAAAADDDLTVLEYVHNYAPPAPL